MGLKKLEHGLGVHNIVYTRGAPKQVEVIISESVLKKRSSVIRITGCKGLIPSTARPTQPFGLVCLGGTSGF